ncbi:MAG TPA: glycosyltransferase family 39 protein, partial [Bryobacteraceae bacterium]|nr:glycosyltransferase family 39 protein [Bryobacteraceae bacterium]
MALLFVAAYGPRLARSLWVDEAGTFWMAHEGLMPAIRKTLHWPGQSVLYSAIASLFCLDGTPFRDELLRVPSLAGIAIGAYFLFRIAESRVGRGSGFVAVTLFLFHPGVYTVAFQARPYALAMAAVIASCWALCEWETSRSRRHLLYYVIALVLVIYLHYFFSVIAVVHALYLGFVFLVEKRRRRWSDPLWAGIAVLLLAIPLAPHLRLLVSERHTLSYVRPPSLLNLTDSLAPSLLWAGLLTAGILLASFFPLLQRDAGRLDRSFGVLLTSWWLAGPLLFFAVSRVTPMRIFVPRYLASALAAQALLLAVVGCRLFGAGGARVWAVVGVALFAANPLLFERAPDGKEVLLPVIRIVRGQAQAPVFFPSLLQESLFYDWRAG